MSSKSFRFLASLTIATVALSVSSDALEPAHGNGGPARGRMVIADRGSGTISVIDTHTDQVVGTHALPPGDNPPEPMYVVYTRARQRVWVGDRANDRVVAFNRRTFEVDAIVPAGAGVFHMWANPWSRQLWINNDIDNTTSVIDAVTLNTLATVPTPADLVALGGKPHDVILGPWGLFAYVTVLGVAGDDDYVVQFCTWSFSEVNRAPVGKDPHVALARGNRHLYVPCQNSDVVVVLDRWTLDEVTRILVPGAHGAAMSRNGRVLYTTNLPGGGNEGLFAINTRTNGVIGSGVDTPYAVPHNLALVPSGRKLYLTHSGASDKVTVYTISPFSRRPHYLAEVTVGSNPFGLAFVP